MIDLEEIKLDADRLPPRKNIPLAERKRRWAVWREHTGTDRGRSKGGMMNRRKSIPVTIPMLSIQKDEE